MNKELLLMSEAGTQDLEIEKLSDIEIMSNMSEIVRTLTTESQLHEGGSAEQTSQEITQNADII